MDTKSVFALTEQLEDNIEDLEDSLGSILETDGAFASTIKKLPLLERAKLNVLVVYAIESLLFSYLKLHGVDAKEHAVFRELTRVKQYFAKIQNAETDPTTTRPTVTVNKEAAGRVIKHALAGNTKYDLKRAEREAREKVRANKRLTTLESIMQEKAKGRAQNEQAEDEEADALQLAAQLASVPQPESPEGSSASENDSEDDDDDEGILGTPDAEEQPSVTLPEVSLEPAMSQHQPPPQQRGKKRKSQQSEEQQPVKKSQKADKKARQKEHPARKTKMEAKKEAKQAKKAQKEAAGGGSG
ncbi:hypothetical protein LTS15_010717 [Exophiala xenobiotica]|nr:hypothetical protein LTS15_010717 [Exophiala xenobiotica]